MAKSVEEKIGHLEGINRELISTQERLLTSQKLATAGRLAAGIAHEIGNPLSAILGYIDLLIKGIVDKGEEREVLKRVEKETVRINNIVKEFLDLSRPPKGNKDKPTRAVDVRDVIQDALGIFEPQKRESSIEVTVNIEENLPSVMADFDRLKQVVLNLLMNAGDAIPDGGKITVGANEIEYDKGKVFLPKRRKSDSEDRDYIRVREDSKVGWAVCISVSDTGKGIAEEDIGKVFDPFFTTKEPGRGTGLGLFISQEIIQAYGGEIRVKSGVDRGAIFEVILPAVKDS
jgi:signal transduction histidine kinase